MCRDSQQLKLSVVHFMNNIRTLQINTRHMLILKRKRMKEMQQRWSEVEDSYLQRCFKRKSLNFRF